MSVTFEIGDVLPPLKHGDGPAAVPLQRRRGTRTASTSTSPTHTRGPRRCLALAPAGALALRCVTEGLGPDWQVTKFAYRLRQPVYAPADLAYSARVTAAEGDTLTLELIEENPSGELGFEGTA